MGIRSTVRRIARLACVAGMPLVTASGGAAAQPLTGAEIVERSQEAFVSARDDMNARVTMTLVNRAGRERTREMTMLRKDLERGEQKYFIYFHRPADVRDMTFMVWRYPDRNDDRWLFVPAIRLVRRLAADDSRSSFVGSDFTYEDVSGRDVAADAHVLTGEEVLGGRTCAVVESTPRGDDAGYRRKVSWIDTDTWLPVKEEYYDGRDELYRVFTADEIVEVAGVPTVVRRTMRNVKTGHRTTVSLDAVEYDVGLSEDLFSERYLRRPPAEWIR